MTWCSMQIGAVAQQQRRVVERAPDVEAGDGEPLRPRVGEERPDGRVQPLGLAQHDVHQLRLLGRQRQLLPQDLDRPRHRGQRIADFVGDAGGHLADRGQPLLHVRVALQLLDVGQVLERDQEAGPSARRLQMGGGQPDVDLAPLIGRSIAELDAPRRGAAEIAVEAPRRARPAAAAPRRSAARRPSANDRPVMTSAARLKRQDALRRVGGRQTARQAVDDVLVERLAGRRSGSTPARAGRRPTARRPPATRPGTRRRRTRRR